MLTTEQFQSFKSRLSTIESIAGMPEERQKEIVNEIMSTQYMDLRCDWAFKYIMDDDEILRILLEDMLQVQNISTIKRLPNESVIRFPDDKSVIFDVVCETPSGKMVVEMQRAKKSGFKNRMVYYGASMIHNQLKKKARYSALMPVYVICFMDYGFKDSRQIISRYALTEQETKELYGDQLWIYLCNLKAFNKKSLKGLCPQEAWLFILKNMINFAGTPEEMGERYSKVADAARMDPMPMDKQLDYVFAMLSEQEKLEIREAAFEDGQVKGKVEGKVEMAREMLNEGVPLDTIAKYSKLPIETISALVP